MALAAPAAHAEVLAPGHLATGASTVRCTVAPALVILVTTLVLTLLFLGPWRHLRCPTRFQSDNNKQQTRDAPTPECRGWAEGSCRQTRRTCRCMPPHPLTLGTLPPLPPPSLCQQTNFRNRVKKHEVPCLVPQGASSADQHRHNILSPVWRVEESLQDRILSFEEENEPRPKRSTSPPIQHSCEPHLGSQYPVRSARQEAKWPGPEDPTGPQSPLRMGAHPSKGACQKQVTLAGYSQPSISATRAVVGPCLLATQRSVGLHKDHHHGLLTPWLRGNVGPARYFSINYPYFSPRFTISWRSPPSRPRWTAHLPYKAHCIIRQ